MKMRRFSAGNNLQLWDGFCSTYLLSLQCRFPSRHITTFLLRAFKSAGEIAARQPSRPTKPLHLWLGSSHAQAIIHSLHNLLKTVTDTCTFSFSLSLEEAIATASSVKKALLVCTECIHGRCFSTFQHSSSALRHFKHYRSLVRPSTGTLLSAAPSQQIHTFHDILRLYYTMWSQDTTMPILLFSKKP